MRRRTVDLCYVLGRPAFRGPHALNVLGSFALRDILFGPRPCIHARRIMGQLSIGFIVTAAQRPCRLNTTATWVAKPHRLGSVPSDSSALCSSACRVSDSSSSSCVFSVDRDDALSQSPACSLCLLPVPCIPGLVTVMLHPQVHF